MNSVVDEVVLGDALEQLRAMGDDSVDHLISDPPYGLEEFCLGRDYGWERGQFREQRFVMDGWDKSGDSDGREGSLTDLLHAVMVEAVRVVRPGGNVVLFTSDLLVGDLIRNAPDDLYYKVTGVWHKKNPIPVNMKIRFVNSTELWVHWVNVKNNGKRTGVFNAPEGKAVHNFLETGLTPGSEKKHGRHSTQKPLSVMKWFVELLTNPGDVVLDPFCGSGSTLVAAKELGRHYVGVEQNPDYVSIAEARLGDVGGGLFDSITVSDMVDVPGNVMDVDAVGVPTDDEPSVSLF